MTSLNPESSSAEQIQEFLKFLYEDQEGYSYVPYREKNKGPWHQEFFKWPEQEKEIVDYILLKTGNEEIYVSPALFTEKDNHKEYFKVTTVAWSEIDGRLPILGNIPEPTLKIQTSDIDHQHWYWKFTEPLTDRHELEAINGSLTYGLGADLSGWDCNQVLRPPSTINHKRDRTTSFLYRGDSRYSRNAFAHLEKGPISANEIDQTTIPDVADVILKYAFNEQSIKQFRSTPQEGERSTALMSLGYLCAEMGMSDAEIYSVVRNADDRWGKFKDRTDRNRRLSDLIARVRVKHPSVEEQLKSERFEVWGFQDFMESEINIEWMVPGLLQKSGYMLLTGPSGVGKTQWSLRWAIYLALGIPFLGFEIPEPKKVIFFSLEMGHADLKYFLTTMSAKFSPQENAILQKNLLIVPLGEALYMDGSTDQKLVEEAIRQHKPDGIFIDSLGSSTSGELVEGPIKLIMDWMDRLRQRLGVFTWIIHHNRKAQSDNKKPNKLSDVYGGQYIVNRATSVFCLWPGKDNIEVIELKVRLKEQADPFFIQRTKDLNFIKLSNPSFYKQAIKSGAAPVESLSYKPPEEPSKEELEANNEVEVDGFVSDKKIPKQTPRGPLLGGM